MKKIHKKMKNEKKKKIIIFLEISTRVRTQCPYRIPQLELIIDK